MKNSAGDSFLGLFCVYPPDCCRFSQVQPTPRYLLSAVTPLLHLFLGGTSFPCLLIGFLRVRPIQHHSLFGLCCGCRDRGQSKEIFTILRKNPFQFIPKCIFLCLYLGLLELLWSSSRIKWHYTDFYRPAACVLCNLIVKNVRNEAENAFFSEAQPRRADVKRCQAF